MDFENAGMDVEDIPTHKIDEALIKVRELELIHDDLRKLKTEASNNLEAAKEDFIKLLQAVGKDRWDGPDGYTGFSMSEQYSYKVPDSPDNKESLLNFIQSDICGDLLGQDPRDIYLKYATVNSRALQTFANTIKKEAQERGVNMDIPGLSAPMVKHTLRSLPRRK